MKPKVPKYETSTRKTVTADLDQFCVLSKEHAFIEITRWTSGEGFDISIGDSHEIHQFSITDGQLDAIKQLTKILK